MTDDSNIQREPQLLELVDGRGPEPAIMVHGPGQHCPAGKHCAHHGADPFFCCRCGAAFTRYETPLERTWERARLLAAMRAVARSMPEQEPLRRTILDALELAEALELCGDQDGCDRTLWPIFEIVDLRVAVDQFTLAEGRVLS